MKVTARKLTNIKDLATISMCVAMIVVCSWLTIPFTVNFTLQTLAIFIVSALLSFKKSMATVCVYILIGVLGVPVFSGFGAGPAALFGATGGFIVGFLFIPLSMKIFRNRDKKSKIRTAFAMSAGLVACYISGTVWYCTVYGSLSVMGVLSAVSVCVLPFILPDAFKIFLAVIISSRISYSKIFNT